MEWIKKENQMRSSFNRALYPGYPGYPRLSPRLVFQCGPCAKSRPRSLPPSLPPSLTALPTYYLPHTHMHTHTHTRPPSLLDT
jgi:hypothetical protein